MIYYIDGYNFLFTQNKEQDPFELARLDVLDQLAGKTQGWSIVVVFDAHNSHGEFSRTYYKGIEVVYSAHGQTADEFLIDQARLSKAPQEMTVVSNDLKLIKEIKNYRAHGCSFNRFFEKLNKKKKPVQEKPSQEKMSGILLKEYLKKFDF